VLENLQVREVEQRLLEGVVQDPQQRWVHSPGTGTRRTDVPRRAAEGHVGPFEAEVLGDLLLW
jgi:hypothetical protein